MAQPDGAKDGFDQKILKLSVLRDGQVYFCLCLLHFHLTKLLLYCVLQGCNNIVSPMVAEIAFCFPLTSFSFVVLDKPGIFSVNLCSWFDMNNNKLDESMTLKREMSENGLASLFPLIEGHSNSKEALQFLK